MRAPSLSSRVRGCWGGVVLVSSVNVGSRLPSRSMGRSPDGGVRLDDLSRHSVGRSAILQKIPFLAYGAWRVARATSVLRSAIRVPGRVCSSESLLLHDGVLSHSRRSRLLGRCSLVSSASIVHSLPSRALGRSPGGCAGFSNPSRNRPEYRVPMAGPLLASFHVSW